MSNTQWLEMDSSHRVGECSVTAVCPLAGVYSRRRLCEIIVVVVVVVVGDDVAVGSAVLAHQYLSLPLPMLRAKMLYATSQKPCVSCKSSMPS